MTYDPDIHGRRSIRLREYDYSSVGAYFVTICVQGRECLFGDVTEGTMRLNDAGKMVERVWLGLSARFPHVVLDEFVVMPNHFHGIVVINNVYDTVGAPLAAPGFESDQRSGAVSRSPMFKTNLAPSLGAIVRGFKSITAIDVNRLLNRQGCPLWQRNYYERVIRNESELSAIREYLQFNPTNWAEDKEHP
ncbi:MAG: hypothetical protein IBX46_12075 [Desulfuromonadales bacterium]|nr:hypothetical protein [Desulfuromonadales bacterium]